MGWVRRLRGTILGSKVSAEFEEEARFHLEQRIDEYVKSGMPLDEARREAARRLGSLTLARERTRDVDTFRWLTDLGQDARYAVRALRRSPGFALVTILTLALGIGANTAMFSVLNTFLLRALPYPRSAELVRVYRTSKESQSWPHSAANFLDYRRTNIVFENMAAFTGTTPTFAEPGQPAERIQGTVVTADFFPALGAQPALGRVFTAAEDQPGANAVAVLSHRFWQRRFGGDPAVLGRRLQIDGTSVEVIGVMPPTFDHPLLWGTIDLWRPLAFTPEQQQNRINNYLQAFGRLKPGVSLVEAQQAMVALAANLSKETSSNQNESLRLEPLQRSMSDEVGRSVMWFTFGLAGCVLLIACANLANLQLVRTGARARDHTIRAALGAGRFRLIRQSLTESLVAAGVGGVLSLAVALAMVEFISRRLFTDLPGATVTVDFRVFGFALICSLVTGLMFGIVPAWFVSRVHVTRALRDTLLGATTSSHRLRHALIVGEVAFALVLLTGAGLFLRGLQRFTNLDPGWRVDGLLTAQLSLQGPTYATPAQRRVFYTLLEQRLTALPGVQGVALSTSQPPAWGFRTSTGFVAEDQPDPGPGLYPEAFSELVNLRYFDTLGVRLLAGRTFTIDDTPEHPPVVIINESMARRFWPNESPIGKRISVAGNLTSRNWLQVIGVVNDVAFPASLDEPYTRLVSFRPLGQIAGSAVNITLRTATAPETFGDVLRRAVAELDPTQPLHRIGTVRNVVDQGLGGISLLGALLGAFAALGLTLAALGIYGVTSYAVVQRTNEFGLRMALGAQANDIVRLIVGQGARLTAYGTVLGVGGAYAVARLLIATIPTLPTRDPMLAFGIAFALVAVALLACYLPARRATTIEPLVALRHD